MFQDMQLPKYFLCPACGQLAEAYEVESFAIICVDDAHEEVGVVMWPIYGADFVSEEGLEYIFEQDS